MCGSWGRAEPTPRARSGPGGSGGEIVRLVQPGQMQVDAASLLENVLAPFARMVAQELAGALQPELHRISDALQDIAGAAADPRSRR